MAGVVHISEEEAARDFGALMQHVRSGDEVRVDCQDGVEAIVKRSDGTGPVKARGIDEVITRLTERKGLAVLDDDFPEARDRYMTPQGQVPVRRTIAEAIEILRLREETRALAVPDPDFASDMEEIHALYNHPMDMSRWD